MKIPINLGLLIAMILTATMVSQVHSNTDEVDDIGHRTEDPGPFLEWPLKHQDIVATTRLPDSPWTHQFLGLNDCPPHYLSSYSVAKAKGYVKEGTTEAQATWQNRHSNSGSKVACYGAGKHSNGKTNLVDHAGTDFSAANGTAVYSAAPADQIYVVKDTEGNYRTRLRHPNVNGTGQTWYTYYVHLSSSEYTLNTVHSNRSKIT